MVPVYAHMRGAGNLGFGGLRCICRSIVNTPSIFGTLCYKNGGSTNRVRIL